MPETGTNAITIRIKREALEFALHAARNTYPEEFIGLLRKNTQGEISEILVIPRSTYGRGFSSIDLTMIPYTSNHCGSVHSHPSRAGRPSRGDLLSFSHFGSINLIVFYPFTQNDVAAYDSEGKKLEFEVVE
ncbi:MAG: metalloprotease [Candidatus Micrarchaeota archaeon]|nr:metalloprotease [Candidatus Micrarchaeota archaeon]